ncbi:hypothetical protein O9H85_18390 [Paenibacillus filicis]|uniref:Uncharacterized protein n=1 Tax=Paenibacillus gyeongsangnamensis TaxID=3388067 RepID=A0ABT4QC49_9BACL|nr:hypothetical protein [Paenibacillus filicis]MCZ8514356.1 hypothetical protein [Paenibacillus filicis]
MFDLIHLISDSQLKKELMKTYKREKSFCGRFVKFFPEHIYFDREFVPIIDLMEKFNYSHKSLSLIIRKHEIETIVHPRNKLILINQKYINILENEPILIEKLEDYVSSARVSDIWKTSEWSVKILCQMLKISSKKIFDDNCYPFKKIEKLTKKVKNYITSYDLKEKYMWDIETLNRHLKRKNIEPIHSDDSWQGYVYLKEKALQGIYDLSNNKEDYLNRIGTIAFLGQKLFETAKLDIYYISYGTSRYPHYLKSEIEKIKELYDDLCKIHDEQSIYRQVKVLSKEKIVR